MNNNRDMQVAVAVRDAVIAAANGPLSTLSLNEKRRIAALKLDDVLAALPAGDAAVPAGLSELIRAAQSHMLRTPEADAISVQLTQWLMGSRR